MLSLPERYAHGTSGRNDHYGPEWRVHGATGDCDRPRRATTSTFTYTAQNSQGRQSAAATVTLIFPPPSNLQVKVLDAQAYNNCNGNSACISGLTPFPDYRWIIEEDKTFWVDPNCTTNSSITTPGCPAIVGTAGQSTIPTFGVNFHTSTMDFVAQGCTGPLSCEGGQTMLDTNPSSPTVRNSTSPRCATLATAPAGPIRRGNGFTPVIPARSLSILPSAITSRCCLVMRPTRFLRNVGAPVCPMAQKRNCRLIRHAATP